MTIGTQRVGFEGPDEYNIMLVGEAPGAIEVGQGRPFVGPAGELLERYLGRHMVMRHQVKLTNLCKHKPSKNSNKFQLLLGSSQLEDGLNELAEEINCVKPNVILALGNWPMYYLTGKCGTIKGKPIPGTGILTYRGSRLPAVERFGGESQKVFCTLHPSYVKRPYNWGWNPVFYVDLGHAVEDSKFPELRYPEYEEYIDPDPGTLQALVQESLNAKWISLDIETNPFCVGWAYEKDGVMKGVCVTYDRPDLMHYCQQVWESNVPKIFQFGTYDIPFMDRFYQWTIGGYYDGVGWDTYVASASLLPDFPRGLDFLISLYTRFPYYKDEIGQYKKTGSMLSRWQYNIKDTVGTYQVAMAQMPEIKELFG